jgi:hypothetical protein
MNKINYYDVSCPVCYKWSGYFYSNITKGSEECSCGCNYSWHRIVKVENGKSNLYIKYEYYSSPFIIGLIGCIISLLIWFGVVSLILWSVIKLWSIL